MILRRTKLFDQWFRKLRDVQAARRILARLDRLRLGNPGDSKSVGSGVVELRIDYGPGYRVYYVQRGQVLVVVLSGGDKTSQESDIQRAKYIAANLSEEDLAP